MLFNCFSKGMIHSFNFICYLKIVTYFVTEYVV